MAGPATKTLSFDERLQRVDIAHHRPIERFFLRLSEFVDQGLLSSAQAAVVQEHVLRLGERNRNPSNTGNLEDLFCYTLFDTRDAIRAYAQVLADSVKVVPMDDRSPLVPSLRSLSTGEVYTRVGDLKRYNAGDKMLITHTMVAFGDPEMRESAAAFVRAGFGHRISSVDVSSHVARMAVQSQHGPSSTFVLARTAGLTIPVEDLYQQAGYSDVQIADAQRFYDVCGHFQAEWTQPFLEGRFPQTSAWAAWRRDYLDERAKLPPELIYQLSSDTLTNFLEGTMESGKWTDASILFGGVTSPDEIPQNLARIVNQYIAEHIALHDRPAAELVEAIRQPLLAWGVHFGDGRAMAESGPPARKMAIRAQFEDSWARMKATK